MEPTPSTAWAINRTEILKWGKNALIFLAPVIAIYLVFVQANLADGYNLSDFVPNPIVIGAMLLYAINSILDFFRKLVPDNTQQ